MGETLDLWDGTREGRADADFYLYPRNTTPAWALRMLPESAHAWSEYDTDPVEAIRITGTWGYHSDYAHAWRKHNQVVGNNPLAADANALTVTDASGLSVGQLLQIESEWLLIEAITEGEEEADPDTLTVARAVRGTSAAAHNQNTLIYVWQPESMIQRACVLWVAYLYSRRGNYADKKNDGMGTITFPPDAPHEVSAILETFAPKAQTDQKGAWGAI
jgi:hypothetical protein